MARNHVIAFLNEQEDHVFSSPGQKLVYIEMLWLSDSKGVIRYSQEDIAELVSLTRPTVAKEIRALTDRSLLVRTRYGRYALGAKAQAAKESLPIGQAREGDRPQQKGRQDRAAGTPSEKFRAWLTERFGFVPEEFSWGLDDDQSVVDSAKEQGWIKFKGFAQIAGTDEFVKQFDVVV